VIAPRVDAGSISYIVAISILYYYIPSQFRYSIVFTPLVASSAERIDSVTRIVCVFVPVDSRVSRVSAVGMLGIGLNCAAVEEKKTSAKYGCRSVL
jgi:hypothetical protein